MATLKQPTIDVRFVASGDSVVQRKQRLTPAEIGLRADMAQFYAMKAVLEKVFGHTVYLKLKETATMKDWRRATIRLLDALALAIKSTVAITDQEWHDDIVAVICRSQEAITGSENISDLFAALSAGLTQIVFMQVGRMPDFRSYRKPVPLKARFWTLNSYRSVQYVQTNAQRQALSDSHVRVAPQSVTAGRDA
jgi:hypothetical protein